MKLEWHSDENFAKEVWNYLYRLQGCFSENNLKEIGKLAKALQGAWIEGRHVFICGNGGSAANAIHLANDFHYGVGTCEQGALVAGIKVEALNANVSIVTCLANDTGYENIFSQQLQVKAQANDILIALSGSGNSTNILRAIKTAHNLEMKSFAIVGFDGGQCRKEADVTIHFPIEDMQIAEGTQLIVGHLCMQWLNTHNPHKT